MSDMSIIYAIIFLFGIILFLIIEWLKNPAAKEELELSKERLEELKKIRTLLEKDESK